MRKKTVCVMLIVLVAVSFDPCVSLGAQSVHLANQHRTGYIAENMEPPFRTGWVYSARQEPRPAWREPGWEPQRIPFDYAYPLSAGNGLVYFGSSADHAVHALDAKTGRERWRFFTDGPVRLAPAVSDGRIYFGSDGGRVYCLDGRTGEVEWSFRPDIPDERLIGNEQMMSRWTAKSGVLVDGDRVFATFGMWARDGVVVCCLDADTGSVIWRNDTSGTHYQTFPHFRGMGGVTPQGYLSLCEDTLVVPCGRAAPAFFDADTGEFIWHEAQGLYPGGAWSMTHGELAFAPVHTLHKPNPVSPPDGQRAGEAPIAGDACMLAMRAKAGEEVFHLRGVLRGVIADEGTMSLIGPKRLVSVRLEDVMDGIGKVTRISHCRGHFVEASKHSRWQRKTERIYTLVQAGDTLIAGGRGKIWCYDADTGQKIWQTEVEGDVRDLLVAPGTL